MLELIINGVNIDTFSKESVEYSRQIATIGEIGSTKGDFTTQVKVPASAANMRLIENSHIIGSTSNFPYNFHECTLKNNGEQIFENGIAYLQSTEDGNLNFSCFGSIISLSKKWDGEAARDLFMPELDETYSVAAITSENNTWEEGFIFPHIYWEVPHTTFLIRPCLFVAYVFRKLFESEGYTITSNIFNDLIFTRAIIPFNGENVEYGKRKFEEAFFEVTTVPGGFSETQSLFGTETVLVDKGLIASFAIVQAGRYEFDAGFFGLNETFVSADLDSSATTTTEFRINGIPFTGFVDCLVGDIISAHAIARFDIYSDPLAPVAGGGTLIASWTGAFLKLKNISTVINLADVLHFEQVLPADWTKLDLFKSIVEVFGLFIDVNNVNRTVNVFFHKELYQNKNDAYDWTEKLSGEVIELNYHAEEYAKSNSIRWESDEVSGINDYVFSITDEILESEKELFTSYFACSAEEDNIAKITQFRAGEFEERDQRLLYIEKLGASYPTGRFLDMKFEPYYLDLAEKMLNRYKQIKVECHLHASDVLTFDFSKPIFFAQFSEFFFCERIESYTNSKELTNVILVRL